MRDDRERLRDMIELAGGESGDQNASVSACQRHSSVIQTSLGLT